MKLKNILIITTTLILGLSASSVFAACQGSECTSAVGNGISAAQQQQQQAASEASNQGNAQSITYNNPGQQQYSGKYTMQTVPGIAAPSLTTTLTETCMGSTTGGVAVVGLGITGGTTWKDEECVRRLNARELAQTLGEKDAAKELLCGNQEINAVYQSLGRPCLMKPSHTGLIPGGALINYREPVEPRPVASHYVAPTKVRQVQQLPVVTLPVKDEQDINDTTSEAILKKAEIARAEMARKGF